jgi:tetratricopeptide (TPR) repeat protein
MSLEKAKQLHQQAEQARENQQYAEALGLYGQALIHYAEADSLVGVSEVHASLAITMRHLVNRTSDEVMKKLWIKEGDLHISMSLEAAKLLMTKGDGTGLPMAYFNAAKFYELKGELPQAIELFEQALGWMKKAPPEQHNRPAVLTDFSLKLALAKFAAGDQQSLGTALTAIAELEADTGLDSDYNTKVWVSGGYLKLATILARQDKEKALTFLDKAKNIIDSDERLKVRKEDLQRVATLLTR